MSTVPAAPVVAVLAGGKGERIGGNKPTVELNGRPLISYPLQAARDAGLETVVIAKPDVRLPPLDETVVFDLDPRRHPLAGVVTALQRHDRVIALACDMPFVAPALLRWIAEQTSETVVTRPGTFMQPFPALYTRRHLRNLQIALASERSLQETLDRLRPQVVGDQALRAFGSQVRLFFSVNTPGDLATAETWLSQSVAP